MAWITKALGLAALVGCGSTGSGSDGPSDPPTDPRPPPDPPIETTGPPPACAAPVVSERVVLGGSYRGGSLGLEIDALDLDRDGCAELAATEDFDALEDAYYDYRIDWSRVEPKAWLFHALDRSGSAPERAASSFVRDGDFHLWARDVALLSTGELVLFGASSDDHPLGEGSLNSWTPRLDGVAELGLDDRQGWVVGNNEADAFANSVDRCRSGLCSKSVGSAGWAGTVRLLEAPLVPGVPILSAWASYSGDEGERAEQAYGEADLDGDGLEDLVIGAYNAAGASGEYSYGRVAVLLDLPSGDHRVWDVADAVYVGTTKSAQFGLNVSAGDLDGDGAPEVLVGAPLTVDDAAFAFSGPFAGEREDDAADWVFRSGDGFEWSGYGLAAGDFDGDGQPDLAVGQPGSLYSAEGPGQVLLFLHPPRGTLTPADADVVLTSGDPGPDAFGLRLEAAALDGDARTDLIVSSPRESGEFPNDGAVHLIYGASL
jgi:hypothetical protein